MINTQPLEIYDFSGGLTDHIYSQDTRKAQKIDNFVILSNRTVITRPGSEVDVPTAANGQIPAGSQRIGCLINYDNNDELFVQSAKKIYYRNPTAYSTLTGPSGNDVFSAGSTNAMVSKTQWNKHIFLTNDEFSLPVKIYRDGSNNVQVRTSGLPAIAAPTVTAGAAGANNYLYAFVYYYEYSVASQTFQDFGPTVLVQLLAADAPDSTAVNITAIPVLSNGATGNYDTANIDVFIYRTLNNGNVFYKVGQVNNGVTTFNDNVSDAIAVDNEQLYINDGTVDNDPPPQAKFIHVVNNTGYYAYLKEGTQERSFTIRQSVPFDPDSVPLLFEDEVEDVITGLSSVQSIPIVFCKRHVYRIEGQFDQFGRGFMSHVRISDTAGCISNNSIVQAENGLFWAGNDGFYYTDGYRVIKISDDNNDNYKSMLDNTVKKERIYGVFDETNRRIYWGVQFNSSNLDNDGVFCLDLRWGVQTVSTFTTWSGGNSFAPTALEIFDGFLYRADKRGYIMIHKEDYTTDPLVDTSLLVDEWDNQAIIHDYISIAFNHGSNFMRKIATRILLTAKNKTNVSIQINAINDDGKIKRELKEIRWRKNLTWGDPDFVWGDPNCIWNAEGLIEQWRRMPAKGLRYSYIQIQITNAYTIIINSDTIGTAAFNNSLNTVTLNISASDWPEGAIGYFISTEADNYERQFEIVGRTNDVLTILDPQNVMPSGNLKWLIKGYKKGEVLNLNSYTLHWAQLSKSQQTFEAGQDGGNS